MSDFGLTNGDHEKKTDILVSDGKEIHIIMDIDKIHILNNYVCKSK